MGKWSRKVGVAGALWVAAVAVQAQAPAGQAGGRGGRGGGAAGGQAPATSLLMPHQPAPVDLAAHDAGRLVWQAQCVNCHGGQARGPEEGPNIIRAETTNYDRTNKVAGAVLGPFLKKGHPTMTGKPSATLTDAEIVQLANFLRQRVNETMRGSPTYAMLPENILTGDAKAGQAFFNGEGGCTKCHTSTSLSLAGIASRITSPQTLQARVVYPAPAGFGAARGGRGGRGAAVAAPPAANPTGPTPPHPLAVKVTITPPTGAPISGTLIEQDAFFIVVSDDKGVQRTVRKVPGVKIVTTNPMQWHVDFVDRITDKQMHDLTAYLWSLK